MFMSIQFLEFLNFTFVIQKHLLFMLTVPNATSCFL